jgi:thiol-disulfide isomerase/thioredoxin
MTDKPDMRGKVVMIDFWATWCPPCRASIPHANELAEEFEDEVVIVGISNEKLNDFKQGLEKYDLKLEEFEYALGVDPEARSAQYVGVQGIPHVVVMSSDGIVRWQGMPQNLTADTLRAIVRADNPKSVGKVNGKPGRWVEG